MSCSPCYVGGCITAPNNCALGAPGGWQKLWFFNRCDITNFSYEALNGDPRGRITGFTLADGAQPYSFAYYKKTGLQFDSEAIDENGFRWTHTVAIPVINRDAETISMLQQMVGAELVFVGLHRDGRYYLAGLGQEGFQLTNWNDTKGRVAADGAVMELRFSLTDIYPQKEVLLNDGIVDPADLVARGELTDALFSQVDCQSNAANSDADDADAADAQPASGYVMTEDAEIELQNIADGTFTQSIAINRDICTDALSVSLNSSTLPEDYAANFPATVASDAESFEVSVGFDGNQPAGTYQIVLDLSSANCATEQVTIQVNVAAT